MTLRKYLVLVGIAFFASVGDVLLARGMRDIGQITSTNWTSGFTAIFTPWVAAGIIFLLIFFASYLSALSWADLSYVLPATAFGYIIVALLGRFLLGEHVSVVRWAGIGLISLGVGFVTRGPALTVSNESEHDRAPAPEVQP